MRPFLEVINLFPSFLYSLPSMHYIIVGPQCSLGLLLKEEPIENGMRKQVLGWGTKEYNEVSDVREWEGDG